MIKIFSVFLLAILFVNTTFAQENDPYSRYGLGDLFQQNLTFQQSMGGIGAAIADPNSINISNPASFADLKVTTFDVAAYERILSYHNADSSFVSANATLNNICLGFPIILDHLGMSFGFLPFSRTQYNLAQPVTADTSSETGTIQNLFTGTGGINEYYIGAGYELKGFAIGAKLMYLSGSLFNTDQTQYNSALYYSTQRQQLTQIGSIAFDAGLQYNFSIRKKIFLRLGLSGRPQIGLTAHDTYVLSRYRIGGTGTSYVAPGDTLLFINRQSGIVILPASLHGGILASNNETWKVSAEYDFDQWSKFEKFGTPDSLGDSWRVAVGGEYQPSSKYFKQYFAIVRYRAGIYFGQDPLQFEGTTFHVKGITGGLGLPVRRSLAVFNVSFDAGERTSSNAQLFNETYLHLYLGVTFNDLWFLKPKFQ
jgi:long-subunit fatty acid transport protein